MDYLDRELPVVDSLLFRVHVMLCTACRRYMIRYKDSTELARKILDDPPPPELINLASEFVSRRTGARMENPSS
jgi:anti-sigma factor RsiW